MVHKIGRALRCHRPRGSNVIKRSLLGSGLLIALVMLPFFATRSEAADRASRGTLNVVVANSSRASGPICLSVRDLTVGMVVGLFCDGGELDLDSKSGRISIDLPRRSFAIDAMAPGINVVYVIPEKFALKRTQNVLVQLSRKPGSGT